MYYDLLVKIKNAEKARKESIQVPYSKFDFQVAKLLADSGFLGNVQKKVVGRKNMLEVELKYSGAQPALSDFKVISKPSRRMYIGYRELKPIRQDFGVAVLSTPAGVMTNKDARKNKVGGEYLFQVW